MTTGLPDQIVWVLLGLASITGQNGFSDISIEKQFKPYLLSNPLLMETTGAKFIALKDGRSVILSVASTVLKDAGPADRLRAEKVCRTKALAGIVSEKKGVQVFHTETLNEQSTVVIDENGETATSVSELLQVTKTKVEGITRDMPMVGRWRSKDGDVFYLAIGCILDQQGNTVVSGQD